jgi:hypothetical protein
MELALNTGIAIDCYEQVGDGGKDDFWILQSVPPLINTGISMMISLHVRRNHTRGICIFLFHMRHRRTIQNIPRPMLLEAVIFMDDEFKSQYPQINQPQKLSQQGTHHV